MRSKHRQHLAGTLVCSLMAPALLGQVQPTAATNHARRWLQEAPPVPEFKVPATRAAWERQRRKIRAELWDLLGRLPPRPPGGPSVQTLAREERPGYVLERFQFDNAAGSTVPGVLLLPRVLPTKAPAILYCHWHGG